MVRTIENSICHLEGVDGCSQGSGAVRGQGYSSMYMYLRYCTYIPPYISNVRT
jgi:hypothetical protein